MAEFLSGKRVFITGAGGALGRASARWMAREGAAVAVVDINADSANETASLITADGGRAVALEVDVRDDAAVARSVEAATAAMGGLDTLVNNAGVMPHQDESMLSADYELWRSIYELNVMGLVNCSRHVVPHIIDAGGGAVVNMGSFLAVIGCTYPQDAYSASKGSIHALTRSMAVQFGPRGIRVNALAPGPIMTAHVEQFFPDPAARALRLARVPLGRFGVPDDVAGLVGFLASDHASWLSGQVITLDGGISVNYI